jgi:hypothetical protein
MARLLFLSLLSAAPTSAQMRATSRVDPVHCGGVTDVATVKRYFSDLRQALTKSSPKNRFNEFVQGTFGVRSSRGHTLYFNVKDFGSVTPGRISIREWREISRRGARSLHNVGWRGCFLDNGKVWFEGSKDGGFRLTLISRDVRWAKPETGDVLP